MHIYHDRKIVRFITRCTYAQGRVKRLSPSIYLRVYMCVSAKTRLFAVLLLENHHEIALYRLASQFIFFERCLQSRTTLLSSAMAMVSNSCTAPQGLEHYGNWVCRPTMSLRECCEHTHEVGEIVSKQCRLARPVRHKSYVVEQRTVQYQHNQKPTTCSVLQNDGPPCRAIQSTYLM